MIDLTLGLTREIIAECEKHGLSRQQTAYVLATAYWETARTMRPVEEAFYLGSKADAYRRKLRYYPWHGRGLVQLTWERNYLRAGQALDVDMTTNPDAAMRPDVSVKILVLGMISGWFTGKRLRDYINDAGANYREARRIINGTDKAAEIAAIAADYERALMTRQPAPVNIPAKREHVSPWAALVDAVMKLFRRA